MTDTVRRLAQQKGKRLEGNCPADPGSMTDLPKVRQCLGEPLRNAAKFAGRSPGPPGRPPGGRRRGGLAPLHRDRRRHRQDARAAGPAVQPFSPADARTAQKPKEAFGVAKAPWATYSLPESLRHPLDGHLLGVERVWPFADLEQAPRLCVKRARDRLPDDTLLSRALARVEAPDAEPTARRGCRAGADQAGYTFDCDSTVETVDGAQAGARVQSPERGRPSYTPGAAASARAAWS